MSHRMYAEYQHDATRGTVTMSMSTAGMRGDRYVVTIPAADFDDAKRQIKEFIAMYVRMGVTVVGPIGQIWAPKPEGVDA